MFRLSLADYRHEWQLSVCLIVALVAVLAPLFILFGLKSGLIDTLAGRLIQDPHTREIKLVGAAKLNDEWFGAMRSRPGVAFLVPSTRSIAATVVLRNPANSAFWTTAELIATAAGDPLLADIPGAEPAADQLVLSRAAASRLNVKAGDRVEANLSRQRHGQSEVVTFPLTVKAVAAEAAFDRPGAFAPLGLLIDLEDYRDGVMVGHRGWEGSAPEGATRLFSGFRLYARSIHDVAALGDALRAQSREVRTKAAEIATMQDLDRNLGTIFWLVAAVAGLGYSVSLGANLWAGVERKRKDLAVMRLLGLRTTSLVWFPLSQALVTSLLGTAVAGAIALVMAGLLNHLFVISEWPDGVTCLILAPHVAVGLVATLLSTTIPAILAGRRASRVDPADSLREV
ncbi:MAG: ABC transporter permease [Phaeospirillum sp.]|nr:ABC transporter permease [Phaeospirillum sp.]